MNVAIPAYGKMGARAFLSRAFGQDLGRHAFAPLYFVASHHLEAAKDRADSYQRLDSEAYARWMASHRFLRQLMELRRFAVFTETTDLRLRENVETALFGEASLARVLLGAAGMDLLRRVPGAGRLAAALERRLFETRVHSTLLQERKVGAVLVPGLGNFGFWNEGFFAREAQALGIPVIAAVTNYDNVVNMGFRGFLPERVAAWSRQMADEIIRLQGVPASRVAITGPIQYDRFCVPPGTGRDEFLRSRGLDPALKTVFYAGGVSVSKYFGLCRSIIDGFGWASPARCNVVFRPWPHPKVLSAPHWPYLAEQLARSPGVHVSNPLAFGSDGLASASGRLDLESDADWDELHGLLKYADVLVSHFSTMGLEAALCDLPTVYIGYDDYTYTEKYAATSAFQQRQTHNRRVLRLEAARVASSDRELSRAIEAYLSDRSMEAGARRAYAQAECGAVDGRAGERLAGVIAETSRARRAA